MIHAYAILSCDAPDCEASLTHPDPLRFGQLNPIQEAELQAAAVAFGWVAQRVPDGDAAVVAHLCDYHARIAAMAAAR